jgi:hypothetical protein
MNRAWQAAALLLAVALAGCGGNDKVTVTQTPQQPPPNTGPGSSPQTPIVLQPDAPAFHETAPGAENRFYSANLPPGRWNLWTIPTPASPLNDQHMQASTSPDFTAIPPISVLPIGPQWGAELGFSNLASPVTVYARVYAETPAPTLTYGMIAITDVPTGMSIGGGTPSNSVVPQSLLPGQNYHATTGPSTPGYFVVPISVAGVYVVKMTSASDPSQFSIGGYPDGTFTPPPPGLGYCATMTAFPPTSMGSCILEAPAGTNWFIKVDYTAGVSGSYDLSVIGP